MWRQCVELSIVSLRSLPSRWGSAQMIIVGTACVVAVSCGLLSLAAGLEAATQVSSMSNRGVILTKGSVAENTSYFAGDTVGRVLQLDHVVTASSELLIHLPLPSHQAADTSLVILRGLDTGWRDVRPEVRLIEGRFFEPGKREVIVGRNLLAEYSDLMIGDAVPVWRGELTVVGHFDTKGGLAESELLADLAMLQNAYGRGNAVNTVRVMLDDAAATKDVQTQIESDPSTGLRLAMEEELHEAYVAERRDMIEAFAYWILGIMAIGAVVASLATMYSAVQRRTKEIATLKAMGFGDVPILCSILFEGLLLALVGAAVGVSLVYAVFDGVDMTTRGNMGNALMFAFRLTPTTVTVGIVVALLLGFAGSLAAGVRASRIPVARALTRR